MGAPQLLARGISALELLAQQALLQIRAAPLQKVVARQLCDNLSAIGFLCTSFPLGASLMNLTLRRVERGCELELRLSHLAGAKILMQTLLAGSMHRRGRGHGWTSPSSGASISERAWRYLSKIFLRHGNGLWAMSKIVGKQAPCARSRLSRLLGSRPHEVVHQ